MENLKIKAALVSVFFVLAGCGGGGGSAPSVITPPHDSSEDGNKSSVVVLLSDKNVEGENPKDDNEEYTLNVREEQPEKDEREQVGNDDGTTSQTPAPPPASDECENTPFHRHNKAPFIDDTTFGIPCGQYEGYIVDIAYGCEGTSGCTLTVSQIISDERYTNDNDGTIAIEVAYENHTITLLSVAIANFQGADRAHYHVNGDFHNNAEWGTYIDIGGNSVFIEHNWDTTVYGEFPPHLSVITLSAQAQSQNHYTLQSGDDAWATDNGFAFNMRGVLRGAAIQTDNYHFAHSDDMRDMHLELRADAITVVGVGLYADSGFKWESGGETQVHYSKAMAIYPMTDNLDLYASAAYGKVHSSYFAESRLFGFSAGSFARQLLGKTDEWHLRVRRPISAIEINPLMIGADVRIGDEQSRLRIGVDGIFGGDISANVQWQWQIR